MFELNEQELEQVAGGRRGSSSAADGSAHAKFGIATSDSYAQSIVTHHRAESSAENHSAALGYKVGVGSSAETEAGSSY